MLCGSQRQKEAGKCESLETVIMGLICSLCLVVKEKPRIFIFLYTEKCEPTG